MYKPDFTQHKDNNNNTETTETWHKTSNRNRNVGEKRRGSQEWTIQRNGQHCPQHT